MHKKEGELIRNFKKDKYIWIGAIIAILVLVFVYYIFIYSSVCDTKECFEKAIVKCKRVSYIREDEQAAWKYDILKQVDRSTCLINVKLLKLNQGTLDAEALQKEEMKCNFLKSSEQFPEKDISRCHGLLKEDLQDILIQRMHNYLLQNVGEIKQSFTGV